MDVRRFTALAALVVALVATAKRAEARDTQLEFQGTADVSGSWLRTTPRYNLSAIDTPTRTVHGVLPSMGSVTMLGGSIDAAWTANGRWIFPVAGLGLSGAVGAYPRILGSADGSVTELHPWSSWEADVLLPGIGMRFKERRWMFSALVRTGVSILGTSGVVATGSDTTDIHPTATTFLLRAQIDACRRIDPVERICLGVSPNLYEFGFLNGGMVSLRWEIGP